MSGDDDGPETPGTGAGGASGPTGASNADTAGASAFGPQEIRRRDVASGETGETPVRKRTSSQRCAASGIVMK